ncbi:MAG TPA: hypothetical protein VG123_09500 [Streptosporangiaceae bacterium]|nr:hypothetical protein [Streptosporangiaceae bacterium]
MYGFRDGLISSMEGFPAAGQAADPVLAGAGDTGRRQGGAGEVPGSFAPAVADPAARGQPHLGGRQPIRIVRAARRYGPSGNCWLRSGCAAR